MSASPSSSSPSATPSAAPLTPSARSGGQVAIGGYPSAAASPAHSPGPSSATTCASTPTSPSTPPSASTPGLAPASPQGPAPWRGASAAGLALGHGGRRGSKLPRRKTVDSECSTHVPGEEGKVIDLPLSDCDFASPSQTMVILDWDDTLFPTTDFVHNWKVACPHKDMYEPSEPERREVLARWHAALRRLLERSCAMSDRCVIITNSRRPWVTDCVKRFAPDLLDIFTREERAVRVVYAGECLKRTRTLRAQAMDLRPVVDRLPSLCLRTPEEQEDELMMAKHAAMRREVKDFYSRYQGQSWKNVISIGDMSFERDALRELTFHRIPDGPEKLRTKTVVEPTDSPASELSLRLQYTTALLPAYIQFDGDFSIELGQAGEKAPAALAEALGLPGLGELTLSTHAWGCGPAPAGAEAERCTQDLDFFVHSQALA